MRLTLHGDEYLGNTATLEAIKNCWVVSSCGAAATGSSRGAAAEQEQWELVSEGKFYTLFTGSHIRLMPPGKNTAARIPHQEFRLKASPIATRRGTFSIFQERTRLIVSICDY